MAKDDWPESRDRLLQDIETFSRKGPPEITEAAPQQPNRAATLASPPSPPVTAKPVAAPQPSSSPPPPAENSLGPSSLLDNFKQQAKVKLQGDEQRSTQQFDLLQRISMSLEKAFRYLNDLTLQLNILKQPYASAYPFFGVVDFEQMAWQEGRADFRMQQVSSEDRFYEDVTLRYRLLGQQKFSVTRDNPAQEKLRKALFDHNIVFVADEVRNDRGRVERATFSFPCEIKAGLVFAGNYETGKLMLRTRNVGRFGTMEFQMAPEAISQEALDELTRLILGESNRIGQLFHRTA